MPDENVLRPLYELVSGGYRVLDESDVVVDGMKPIAVGRKEITSDYTLESNVSLIAIGNITAPITITIPSDENYLGRIVIIQDEQGDAGTHTVTIETEGSENINGSSDWNVTSSYDRVSLYSNGNKWLL